MNKHNVFAPVTLNIVHGSIKLEFHPHSADRADKGLHNQIKGKRASGRHNQMKMKKRIVKRIVVR